MATFNILTGNVNGKLGVLKGDVMGRSKAAVEIIPLNAENSMTDEQKERIRKYGVAVAAAQSLLDNGFELSEKQRAMLDRFTQNNIIMKTSKGYTVVIDNCWQAVAPEEDYVHIPDCDCWGIIHRLSKTIEMGARFTEIDGTSYGHLLLGDANGKELKSFYSNTGSIHETFSKVVDTSQRFWAIAYQNVRRGRLWVSGGYNAVLLSVSED